MPINVSFDSPRLCMAQSGPNHKVEAEKGPPQSTYNSTSYMTLAEMVPCDEEAPYGSSMDHE